MMCIIASWAPLHHLVVIYIAYQTEKKQEGPILTLGLLFEQNLVDIH
jgi:hypothetical protein